MNGGVYFFKKKILNLIPKKKFSLENDFLPNLIDKKLLIGKMVIIETISLLRL